MEAVQMEVSMSTATEAREPEVKKPVGGVGSPSWVPAAIEAVQKWRYRPSMLKDEPVEVETTITVNFKLSY
jgi:hypothetical protein